MLRWIKIRRRDQEIAIVTTFIWQTAGYKERKGEIFKLNQISFKEIEAKSDPMGKILRSDRHLNKTFLLLLFRRHGHILSSELLNGTVIKHIKTCFLRTLSFLLCVAKGVN